MTERAKGSAEIDRERERRRSWWETQSQEFGQSGHVETAHQKQRSPKVARWGEQKKKRDMCTAHNKRWWASATQGPMGILDPPRLHIARIVDGNSK